MSFPTAHEQVHTALYPDPVLAALGFDHRCIGDRLPLREPALYLRWEEQWHAGRAGFLGGLNVEPRGMDELSANALLNRVAIVLCGIPSGYGPVRRITGDPAQSGRFVVVVRGDPIRDRAGNDHRSS